VFLGLDQLLDAADRKLMREVRNQNGNQQQAGRETCVIEKQTPKQADAGTALRSPAIRVPLEGHRITFRQRYRHGKPLPVTATG
jgi:hypothetical protein